MFKPYKIAVKCVCRHILGNTIALNVAILCYAKMPINTCVSGVTCSLDKP